MKDGKKDGRKEGGKVVFLYIYIIGVKEGTSQRRKVTYRKRC
jgi:hypothetical protein